MEAENFKKLQEKATGLKVAIKKNGKLLSASELNKAVQAAEAKLAEEAAEKLKKAEEDAEKKEIEAKKKEAKEGEKTIKVLKSLSGKFLLSHTPGAIINIEAKQADEICEDHYGKEL